MKSFFPNIQFRNLIKDSKYSYRSLAEVSGIWFSVISNYALGITKISKKHAEILAPLLETSADYLLSTYNYCILNQKINRKYKLLKELGLSDTEIIPILNNFFNINL